MLFAKNQKKSTLMDFNQKIQNYCTQKDASHEVSLRPFCFYGYLASLLRRYGIADHEVQQLKQTTEGAILSFLELIFIFIISLVIGLFPAILWGPIRLASSYLAEQHRKKALAASKVKITGRDVVARCASFCFSWYTRYIYNVLLL